MVSREAQWPAGLSVEAQLVRLGFDVSVEPIHYLGLVFKDDGAPTIYGVLDTSPAGRSRIAAEDVITRVNGFPFSRKALQWVAERSAAVTLEVLRGHRSLTFTITPETRKRIASLSWQGTDEQARRIGSWLHLSDFRPSAGHKFALDFYENFHGIETIS